MHGRQQDARQQPWYEPPSVSVRRGSVRFTSRRVHQGTSFQVRVGFTGSCFRYGTRRGLAKHVLVQYRWHFETLPCTRGFLFQKSAVVNPLHGFKSSVMRDFRRQDQAGEDLVLWRKTHDLVGICLCFACHRPASSRLGRRDRRYYIQNRDHNKVQFVATRKCGNARERKDRLRHETTS